MSEAVAFVLLYKLPFHVETEPPSLASFHCQSSHLSSTSISFCRFTFLISPFDKFELKWKPRMGDTAREEIVGEDLSDSGDYEVVDLRDKIKSSRGSRFDLIANQLLRRRYFSRQNVITGFQGLPKTLLIHPDNRFFSQHLFLIIIILSSYVFLKKKQRDFFLLMWWEYLDWVSRHSGRPKTNVSFSLGLIGCVIGYCITISNTIWFHSN